MTVDHPSTPDGRYFVVRGRLWRCSDPSLPAAHRQTLVDQLMRARRILTTAANRSAVRKEIDDVKRALGERGAVWWSDGAADYNRQWVKDTPYARWFSQLAAGK